MFNIEVFNTCQIYVILAIKEGLFLMGTSQKGPLQSFTSHSEGHSKNRLSQNIVVAICKLKI